MNESEAYLLRRLRDAPREHGYRYTQYSAVNLLKDLFHALACNRREYLALLFPNGLPTDDDPDSWKLSAAQGAVEGAEYTSAARGKTCGHIFRAGESTYRCKTCAYDDTCVLCARCFEASDHDGHAVYVTVSGGGSGCCDCGDPEAWAVPVKCAIHTAIDEPTMMDVDRASQLPAELIDGVKSTIARAIDYLCDVLSCSPEQLRLKKTEEDIRNDEKQSRLTSMYIAEETDADNIEYCMVLWNDEKHTVDQVRDQVARACKATKKFGLEKAHETDAIGRSIIAYDTDVNALLKKLKIIEQIRVTVTIRSSRDTYREQMCGTIIEWLEDISGCSVGEDSNILRRTICEELLGAWRVGSRASNTGIGLQGIDDHAADQEVEDSTFPLVVMPTVVVEETANDPDDMDVDAESDTNAVAGEEVHEQGDDDGDDVEMVGAGHTEQHGFLNFNIQHLLLRPVQLPAAPVMPQYGEPDGDGTGALAIPRTPNIPRTASSPSPAPWYWTQKPKGFSSMRQCLPPYEDLRRRVRLDWLIMFDLRLWKQARTDLRDLYIGTVVAIPEFKRILGLRFAGLYTALSELYLIADREPEHSIINLSLQMLTTPTITAEVVRKGNFFSNLMAILYTFLTTRQVGWPKDVNPDATLAFDGGSNTNPLTNRRMYRFFHDLRHLFGSEYVHQCLREEQSRTLQFLDLVRLHQGICPNQRAIAEHVEYEADAWISAAVITREVNKLARMFANAFKWDGVSDSGPIRTAIDSAARYATIASMGWEYRRAEQTEMKLPTEFRFTKDAFPGAPVWWPAEKIVKFQVGSDYISFHHALHYTLSWLIEAGKDFSSHELRQILVSTWENVRRTKPESVPDVTVDDLALAMFDIPLRVCAWIAQMKVGMWVRNGFSLKHQMQTYRSVSQRELTHNRDIFMLQTAMVVTDPQRLLLNMVDRFSLNHWMRGEFKKSDEEGIEESQILDLAEEFLHLLIVMISERLPLISTRDEPNLQVERIKRDLLHVLYFKPMQFSELARHLPDRLLEHDKFQEVLTSMTKYRPPDGLSDYGQFELKEEYLDEIDPFNVNFNKNQREETEASYRARIAKKAGKKESEIVFVPELRPIPSGLFKDLARFTGLPVFAYIVARCLEYVFSWKDEGEHVVQETRMESFLNICLHLIQLGVLEDNSAQGAMDISFILHALSTRITSQKEMDLSPEEREAMEDADQDTRQTFTIATLLRELSNTEEFKACRPKIHHLLRSMKQKKPYLFGSCVGDTDMSEGLVMDEDQLREAELERKKQLAKERQAAIMAQMRQQQQNFMNSAGFKFDDENLSDEELDETLPTAEANHWKYPTGTCILCQEEMNDTKLYGTLGLITETNLMRQTDPTDTDYLLEVVELPDSLDRSARGIRPYGVASMNRQNVTKLAADGTEIKVERQGLGRGFPYTHVKRGTVSIGCSHLMHFSCFEHYCESARRRQPTQVARNHPETLKRKEFVCPLCKALGNAFLPIIWKGKEEISCSTLASGDGFPEWLRSVRDDLFSCDGPANDNGGLFDPSAVRVIITRDSSANLIPSLAAPFANTSDNEPEETQPRILQGALNTIQAALDPFRSTPRGSEQLDELRKAYSRLHETMLSNGVKSRFFLSPTALKSDWYSHWDALARTFGTSISTIEIAQRGVASETGSTLLDRISDQSLAYLRIFSETISAYALIGTHAPSALTLKDFTTLGKVQMAKLFSSKEVFYFLFGQDPASEDLEMPSSIDKPLLLDDIFIFLAECSLCLAPSTSWDIMHILRMCYVAQIVQVVIFLSKCNMEECFRRWGTIGRLDGIEGRVGYREGQLDLLRRFRNLIGVAYTGQKIDDANASLPLAVFRQMLAAYMTPFLRKCVILLYTRFGILFPPSGFAEAEEPEHIRLCTSLKLPNIDEILAECLAENDIGSYLRETIENWCKHAAYAEKEFSNIKITVPHPAIYELVALPRNYDLLVEESARRKCPSNPTREVTDPSICLFCGEIFCSQAVCCMVKDPPDSKTHIGGCNRHMAKCGGNSGIFIDIRKCALLFLHKPNGTFAETPYMDAHGETDLGLKRARQQFLNSKRYDALVRDVWLRHGIPSVISRKLEADMNNGGWETL
ncbi:hypothetical protein EX30DRAFT_322180 [Ascodesmis nigricans]|uniref:E3 ubiquitin-protein ligase n=1 Tax=Ascodesmis nigricans TaxID=341454 RepID=A0A4S2MND3_9PEZI|nr:hypothetical protein EX30DRAFT_322180 [Ascodesmis nigricans]